MDDKLAGCSNIDLRRVAELESLRGQAVRSDMDTTADLPGFELPVRNICEQHMRPRGLTVLAGGAFVAGLAVGVRLAPVVALWAVLG